MCYRYTCVHNMDCWIGGGYTLRHIALCDVRLMCVCLCACRMMDTKVLVHCKMGISRSAATVSDVYNVLTTCTYMCVIQWTA